MSKKINLLAAVAAIAVCRRRIFGVRAKHEREDHHGRRRGDVSVEEHHSERGQLKGPHHAGRGREGRRALSTRCSGKGPFTVFAPTNAAFAKLPAGTVENLVKPENKATLTKILTCHVVAADALAGTIKKMIADDKGDAQGQDRRRLRPRRQVER